MGGAAGAADLGSSSKYSYEKQTLNAEVEAVSPTTAFVRGLVGNLSLTGNLNGDLGSLLRSDTGVTRSGRR